MYLKYVNLVYTWLSFLLNSHTTILVSVMATKVSLNRMSASESHHIEAFQKIYQLVKDLHNTYTGPDALVQLKQVDRYYRIIKSIEMQNMEKIKLVVKGFEAFYVNYRQFIIDNRLDEIKPGTNIFYSANIHLPISQCIRHGDVDAHKAIRAHFLSIGICFDEDESMLSDLLKNAHADLHIDPETVTDREREFLNGFSKKFMHIFTDGDASKNMDIEDMMRRALDTGMMKDIDTWLKVNSEDIDPVRMFGLLQTDLTKAATHASIPKRKRKK